MNALSSAATTAKPMLHRTTLAMTLLLVMCPAAFAAESFMVEKLPYLQARNVLLSRGFRPFSMPGTPDCDPQDNKCFPEIERCVQRRHWVCNYTWQFGKSIYHMETRAQKKEPPVVDSFYCLLNCGRDFQIRTMTEAAGARQP